MNGDSLSVPADALYGHFGITYLALVPDSLKIVHPVSD